MATGIIDFTLVTPERALVHEQVDELQIPGAEGYLGILPGLGRKRVMEMTDVKEERVPVAALAGRSLFIANAVRGIVEIRPFTSEESAKAAIQPLLARNAEPFC